MSGRAPAGPGGPSGAALDDPPRLFTLGRPGGLQITVMDVGATWLSCRVPLAGAEPREVLLGHATPQAHRHESGYLGATIGRYANRIARARFTLDGVVHRLQANEGPHQLHGGAPGFDRRRWHGLEQGPLHLRLGLHAAEGDQGYPGALRVVVTYRLDPVDAAVHIGFEAESTRPTPVCLTNHAYFNLGGAAATDGADDAAGLPSRVAPRAARGAVFDVRQHRLRVAAAQVLPVDAALIPTGEHCPVDGTPFDLRSGERLAEVLGKGPQQVLAGGGLDHCFVLDADCAGGRRVAAELQSPDGRLVAQLSTDYPGLQVYSGNHLARARGRDGASFAPHAGIALEPQFFPDSPNRPAWAAMGCILRPGERFSRFLRWRFVIDPAG